MKSQTKFRLYRQLLINLGDVMIFQKTLYKSYLQVICECKGHTLYELIRFVRPNIEFIIW